MSLDLVSPFLLTYQVHSEPHFLNLCHSLGKVGAISQPNTPFKNAFYKFFFLISSSLNIGSEISSGLPVWVTGIRVFLASSLLNRLTRPGSISRRFIWLRHKSRFEERPVPRFTQRKGLSPVREVESYLQLIIIFFYSWQLLRPSSAMSFVLLFYGNVENASTLAFRIERPRWIAAVVSPTCSTRFTKDIQRSLLIFFLRRRKHP